MTGARSAITARVRGDADSAVAKARFRRSMKRVDESGSRNLLAIDLVEVVIGYLKFGKSGKWRVWRDSNPDPFLPPWRVGRSRSRSCAPALTPLHHPHTARRGARRG